MTDSRPRQITYMFPRAMVQSFALYEWERQQQAARAERMMAAYIGEARRLGCEIVGEEIVVTTPEQAKALDEFWKRLIEQPG